jgi:hypothetical protein
MVLVCLLYGQTLVPGFRPVYMHMETFMRLTAYRRTYDDC